MSQLLAIGLGGFVGAITRYSIHTWALRLGTFPYGTLIVNVAGCFLLGAIYTFARERDDLSVNVQSFLTFGFLGSLTTFSTFSGETAELLRQDHLFQALANIALNLFLGLVAVGMGRALVLRLVQ